MSSKTKLMIAAAAMSGLLAGSAARSLAAVSAVPAQSDNTKKVQKVEKAGAKALAAETEARLEALRDEEDGKPVSSSSGTIAGFGPWSIFANVQGEWFDQDRNNYLNERGFDGHRYGGSFGADYRLSAAARLGVMFHYEKYSSTFDSELPGVNFNPDPAGSGGLKSKTTSVTAYTTVSLTDSAWFDASAGYGWSKNTLRRNAIFQPSDREVASTRIVQTVGKADGDQLFGSMGLGYDFSDGAASVTPYARLRYIRTTVDALRETGGNNLAMNFSKQKATSLTATVGASASYAISASWGVVVPSIRIEVEHEFKDDPRSVEARFNFDTRNTVFLITNDAPDRSYSNAGAGLVFVLPGGVMPYVDYEALLGYSNFHRSRVTAGLRLEF
jgi:outer membrane autotransporter protein